jgi:hypothetical protein
MLASPGDFSDALIQVCMDVGCLGIIVLGVGFVIYLICLIVAVTTRTQDAINRKVDQRIPAPAQNLPEVGPRWSDRPSTQPTDAVQPSRDGTTEADGK